jgi:hypothetical protein
MVLNRLLAIDLWLYSPFVGPWSHFQFLNPIHSRWDPLDGGLARRKAAAYTQNNKTQNKRTHMRPYFELDSNTRSQPPRERRRLMPQPARPL